MFSDQIISTWFLNNISSTTWISYVAKFLSVINGWGQMWLVIVLALIIRDAIKNKKFNFYYLIVIIPVVAGWALCEYFIKVKVGRIRPYHEIEGFTALMDSINYKYPSSFSFPSGHTYMAFASAFALGMRNKKLMPYFYVLAVLIGLSRIILGAHYLSDVIAGAGIGTAFGAIGYTISNKFTPMIESKLYKDKNNEVR